MTNKKKTFYAAAMFLLAAVPAVFTASARDPVFSAEVSAADRREHFVRINRWGRYRFEASGADGVTLQVSDKLRGAFAETKTSGPAPAVIEEFLEAGDYKVVTEGPEDGGGSVKAAVWEYVLNETKEYLVVHRETAAELGAADAVAWWIFVPRDTLVYIEAAGRHLGGLAVFRSGEDLLVAEASAGSGGGFTVGGNTSDERQRPLNGLRAAHRLQRGKHLVVAYGGGRDRYTAEDENSPLFIQWMIQPLDRTRQLNGRIRNSRGNKYALSPPSQNWIIESDTVLTLELITVTAGGSVGRSALNAQFSRSGAGARYAAALQFSSGTSDQRYLSLHGTPGTEFRLTPVGPANPRGSVTNDFIPREDGDHRVRTMHTGHHEDNIGASGVLVDLSDTSVIALSADTLSESSPSLRREFNLLASSDNVTSFLWVDKPNTYRFEPEGTNFNYRVRRFYVTPPRNYREPDFMTGAKDISLDAGLYAIEISAARTGALGRAGFTIAPSELYGWKKRAERIEPVKPRAALSFTNIALKRGNPYRIYVNSQAPEAASVIWEKLPLEDNRAGDAVYFIDGDAEREELTTEKLPALELGKTMYAIYDRTALKTYRFEIKEEGIYKIETTGRLHTKITVSNRVGAVIAFANGNGAGRNSVIAEYFLPGQYALKAETQGESAGQMGVVINRGDLTFGGQLEDWADVRTSVGAFGAVVYNIAVSEDGRYGLNSYGQSGMMRVRIADGDGWPVLEHGALMPKEVDMRRGAYRLFSLPLTYASERVTGIRRLGNISAVGCVDSLRGERGFLRAGMCYNFIRAEPPNEEEHEEEYDYEEEDHPYSRRRSEPAYTVSGGVVPVRVDTAGVYEIYSQGGTEVSARLFSYENGEKLAARNVSDERNWNFVISERLDTGTYYLKMTPAARRFPSTQVFMRRVEDTLMRKIELSAAGNSINAAAQKITLNGKQAVIPIEISSGDVLTLRAASVSRIACVLESRSSNHEITFDRRQGREIRISVPIEQNTEYTLKIRSLDGWTGGAVDLAVGAAVSTPVDFKSALAGVSGTVERNPHFGNEAFFRIDGINGGPGHYELAAAENEIVRALGSSAARQIFQKEEGSLLAAFGDRLWFKAAFGSAGGYNFILSPVRLSGAGGRQPAETGGRSRRKFETADQYRHSRSARSLAAYPVSARGSVPVTIRGDQSKIFEIDTSAQNLGLLTFTMDIGRPVAGLSTVSRRADFTRDGIFVYGGQYLSEKTCVTAAIPGDTGRVIVWNALASDNPTDGVSGVLTMMNYAAEEGADTLKTGRAVWRSQTPAAKEYRLEPARARFITAKLSPRSGILYVAPDGKRTMYYGGDGGAVHAVELNGGRMFLFGGEGEDNAAANIELEAFASEPSVSNVLSNASAFKKHFSVDTREAVRADGRDLGRVRVFRSGAVRNVDFINSFGRMTQNVPSGAILEDGNGTLFADFASGWSVLKFCPAEPDDQAALAGCMWGEPTPDFAGAPVVRETSRLIMAAGVNRYNIELNEPAHVSFAAPAPAAALTTADGGRYRVYGDHWEELSIDAPLGAGSHTVGLKPIAGRSLDGVPLTIRLFPIYALTEDDPLALYLPPGEKRMARFDLERKSRVGIGLRAASETVEATLLDGDGKRLTDRGRQIFIELDKGAYYVLLSTPVTSDGVDVTVFLFGQNAPPLDPPQDLIRWFAGGGVGERP